MLAFISFFIFIIKSGLYPVTPCIFFNLAFVRNSSSNSLLLTIVITLVFGMTEQTRIPLASLFYKSFR